MKSSSGAAVPGAEATGGAAPGVATPGVATPGVATPGVATPGVAIPGVATPGVATPGSLDGGCGVGRGDGACPANAAAPRTALKAIHRDAVFNRNSIQTAGSGGVAALSAKS
jgi:DNA polymerase-3 subunit gamma/tau